MSLFARRVAVRVAALLAATAFFLSSHIAAGARSTSSISGVVRSHGIPSAGAIVELSGSSVLTKTISRPDGRFMFGGLHAGRYTVSATLGGLNAISSVNLTSAGEAIGLELAPVKEIGRTSVTSRSAAQRRGGTDVTLNRKMLSRLPSTGSFSDALLQVPGAARGANGVVHINGDHGDINYVIDGVALSQALNRVIGSEVQPGNVSDAEVLEGAYPAQYGEKFGAVLNLTTRGGPTGHGFDFETNAGSFAHFDSAAGYRTPIGPGGSLLLGLNNERDGRALDPSVEGAPHNAGSNTNEFLRLALPHGATDYLNVTISHSLQTYQIPPDLTAGAPAKQDDNERQDDIFSSLQYRHAIGDRGALSFGPSIKRSHIVDYPDTANDIRATGSPRCATDITACGFGVFANRTSLDYRFNVDYALRSDRHDMRYGALYDATNVTKLYAVTLQTPNVLGPRQSNVVTDTAPNNGSSAEFYLQDSWKIGARYQLDYGVREDLFTLRSSEFAAGSAQASPRLKLTRFLGDKASVYAYFGRFFTPYSFENVSPHTAAILQPASGSFDLLPQRDSTYEIGGHVPIGNGDLGLRVMQKNATDLIDDTQVGATNLHQDINYKLGRIATQTAYYQVGLPRSGRVYISATHTYSVVKDCETTLLAPCFSGPALDWTPADHDQRVDLNGGVLLNDRRNGWFSLDAEYGSGLTTAPSDITVTPAIVNPYCPPDPRTGVGSSFCKVLPHLTFDTEKGFGVGHATQLTLRIRNLLNDRYAVTYRNAQGNHVMRPRSLEFGLGIRRAKPRRILSSEAETAARPARAERKEFVERSRDEFFRAKPRRILFSRRGRKR